MYSIPMETSNQNENDEAALDRLIEEELPGMASVLSLKKERVGWYQVVSKTWVTLYATKTRSAWLPANTPEVGNYVWRNPVEALNLWLRRGAREMIKDFLHARKWVVCTRCQSPPSAPIQSVHYKAGPA